MAIPLKVEWDDAASQWVEATGRPGAPTAEWNGYQWVSGKNPEGPGAISRGITTGVETTKGLLSEALPALVQSAFGYDEAAQKNLLEYQERLKKLQESGLGSRVGLEDIKDVGSFLSFLGESVGEGAVSLATAAIPGVGLGAAGASTVGRAAVSRAAGKVASTAAETAAKEIAKREAAGIAVDAGMRAAIEKAALEAAPAVIGRNWGQMAGLALGSAAQNMPETFAKIYTETGEMRPEVASMVGALKTSLDILGPLQLIKKTRGIDFSEKLSDVLAGRLLKGMPGTAGAIGGLLESAALEGLTEGTQELIDQLAVATLADKSINWKDIAEASLKGAFGTAVPGAAAGFVGQRAKAREAAQLGEIRGEQQAEEQRQVELQERYALLGEEPPAGPNFQRDAVSLLRRSNPNVPFTDEGRVDLEAAEKYAEENLPPSQRKAYLKKMRKLDLEAQDQVFLYVKDQEAKKVAREQEATRRGEARRAEEAQRASDADIIQRGNADSDLLRDPAFRQQFDEARARETQRRTQERTERLTDEEMLAGLGFGDFPSRATPLQTERAQVPEDVRDALLDAGYRLDQIAQMGPERAQQVAASLQREGTLYGAEEPTKLLQSERQVVEDFIREQPRNAPIPLDILQQRLADQGRDVTLAQARDILSQYVETRPPALRVVEGKTQYPAKPGKGIRGPINVPGDVRLVEEDGQFSKVGARTEKAAPGERTTDVLDRVHNALVDMPEGTPVGKREIDNIVQGLGAEPLSSRGLSDLYRTLRQRGVLGQLTPRGYLVQRAEPIANIPEVEGPPPAPAARSASPGTEVSRPVTPLQGTLQNPPAGLTPQQYEAMRNRVIRMDPKKILTKKDLDAAGGPGVELTQQQAKDIWEALSSNGDVKRAGLGFRVNPEAELSTQFRDEGSPRMDRPTEVTGQELLDKGTRNKLYGLGYTREDINGMSVEEARDVAERREKKPPAAQAMSESLAEQHARDIGGRVVWQEGNLALVQTSSMLGNTIYVIVKGDRLLPVSLDRVLGNAPFTKEELAKLRKASADVVAAENKEAAANPNGPFQAGEKLHVSYDVKPEVAGIVREWMGMLGLGGQRILLVTPEAAREMSNKFAGKWRRLFIAESRFSSGRGNLGLSIPLGEGDHAIVIRPGMPIVKTLEILAHEMGHIVEKVALQNASPEVRRRIEAAFKKFQAENLPKSAREYAEAMRALRSGRTIKSVKDFPAKELTPYWRSFGEWFADQVSRWATTQEKPLTAVDKFFKKLADTLRRFFTGERSKFAPSQEVAEWLNSLQDTMPPSATEAGIPQAMSSDLSRRGFLRGMGQAAAAVSPTGRALASAGAGAGKALDMGKAMRDIISGKGIPGLPSDWHAKGRQIKEAMDKAEFNVERVWQDYFNLRTDGRVSKAGETRNPIHSRIQKQIVAYHEKQAEIGEALREIDTESSTEVIKNILEQSGNSVLADEFDAVINGYDYNSLISMLRRDILAFKPSSDYEIFRNRFEYIKKDADLDESIKWARTIMDGEIAELPTNYIEHSGNFRRSTYDILDILTSNNFDKPENRRAFAEFIRRNVESDHPFSEPISEWPPEFFDRLDKMLEESREDFAVFRKAKEIVSKIPASTIYSIYQNTRKASAMVENVLGVKIPKLQELGQKVTSTIRDFTDVVDKKIETKKRQEKLRQENIPVGREQWTTLGQDRAWRAISEFFPEVNSRELNLPKGNKDLAEFARKLNDDINRQVEMGEPATKPYDCR